MDSKRLHSPAITLPRQKLRVVAFPRFPFLREETAFPGRGCDCCCPSTNITVTRTGDTSGTSAVEFRTGNNSYVACNVVGGSAAQNCDFILSSGTLNFAAGQTSRSFPIIIIDDLYVEGNETLSLSLSNPSGAVLGTNTATLTITDNDSTTATTNPPDDAAYANA